MLNSTIISILYIIAAINFILSLVILLEGFKDRIGILFGLLTLTVGLWAFSIIGFYSIKPILGTSSLWISISHSSALLLAFLFFYFSLVFPVTLIKRQNLLILPLIFFLIIIYYIFNTNQIIGGVAGIIYEINSGYIFYEALIGFYFFTGYLFLFLQYHRSKNIIQKKQVVYVMIGSITASLLATFTDLILPFFGNFKYTWLGPIFTLFLIISISIAILKYHLFNIKLIIAELLTFAIWIAVLTQAIMADTFNGRLLGGGTLAFAVVLGIFLIKSVKKEVAQREEIEALAGRLKSVNRIMSHDIKNVLGKNKDMYGMLLDNTFGPIPDGAKPFLERLLCDTKQLVRSVISILESGQELTLKLAPFDAKIPVLEIIKDVSHDAEEKGLTIKTNIDESQDYTILGDEAQLSTRVFRNLIENAVNYTLAGSVTVGLSKKADKVIFSVADTGVGITEEDQKNLFQEGGHGKDSIKVNVHSTGYGLFSAKKVVDAHKGKIWFETEAGKGTTFFVEMGEGRSREKITAVDNFSQGGTM